jgi:hypothetical protein
VAQSGTNLEDVGTGIVSNLSKGLVRAWLLRVDLGG